MMSRALTSLVVCVLFACLSHGTARPAELTIFASRAIWTVLTEIGPEFEKNSGHKLDVITGLSSEFVRRVNAGAMFDVIAAPPAALDGLISSGKAAADSKTNLARSAYGVVVRAGAPKPDVSTVEAFKQAMLKANLVAMPGSTSGIFLMNDVFPRLGIADKVRVKATPRGSAATAMVASGEADIVVMPVSEIVHARGVDYAGKIPEEIQLNQIFAAAVVAGSKEYEAAKRLIAFLASEQAAATIHRGGMEPLGKRH